MKVSGSRTNGNICCFSIYKRIHSFSGVKNGLRNDGFGSNSASRKSEEVRLGPEWTGHLPRWCGRADIQLWVINHGNITPGSPEKHPFELILASGCTFSGLNHLLGGVKTSYLVQSGQDTSPDVLEGSRGAQKQYITVISRLGCPENTISGAFGPLEALFRASAIL